MQACGRPRSGTGTKLPLPTAGQGTVATELEGGLAPAPKGGLNGAGAEPGHIRLLKSNHEQEWCSLSNFSALRLPFGCDAAFSITHQQSEASRPYVVATQMCLPPVIFPFFSR